MKKNKIKVVFIGDPMVGKSSIISSFVNNKHIRDFYLPTIGIDSALVPIRFRDKKVDLDIFDIAGQGRYVNLTKKYLEIADAIVIVFDLSRIETINTARHWYHFCTNMYPNQYIVVLGNKADLTVNEPNFNFEIPYTKISAKTGKNIQATFIKVIKDIIKHRKKKKKFYYPSPQRGVVIG